MLPQSALIIIDMQVAVMHLSTAIKRITKTAQPYSFEEIIKKNKTLITHFEREDLPIYLVSVQPKVLTQFLNKKFGRLLLESQKANKVIKFGPSAFQQSTYPLEKELREAGISKLYISGVATSNGVIKTAKDGQKLGFDVVIITDASSDMSLSKHQKALTDFGNVILTSQLKEINLEV